MNETAEPAAPATEPAPAPAEPAAPSPDIKTAEQVIAEAQGAADALAAALKAKADEVEASARAAAVAANVATAKEMHGLGQELAKVGAWLHATTAGAFESVEHAIERILG